MNSIKINPIMFIAEAETEVITLAFLCCSKDLKQCITLPMEFLIGMNLWKDEEDEICFLNTFMKPD